MVIKFTTYTNQNAAFYIQNKGDNSGRPSKKPIRNSFAVFTDVENAFEIAYCVWLAKRYYPFIYGSVIPTMRMEAVKEVLKPAIEQHAKLNKEHLRKLEAIDQLMENAVQQKSMLKTWQRALAFETLKGLES